MKKIRFIKENDLNSWKVGDTFTSAECYAFYHFTPGFLVDKGYAEWVEDEEECSICKRKLKKALDGVVYCSICEGYWLAKDRQENRPSKLHKNILDNWEEEFDKEWEINTDEDGYVYKSYIREVVRSLLEAKDAECEEKSRKQNKTAALDEDYRRLNDFGKRVLREMEKYYGSNRRNKPQTISLSEHKEKMREAIEEAYTEGWSNRGKTIKPRTRSKLSVFEIIENHKESKEELFKKHGLDKENSE